MNGLQVLMITLTLIIIVFTPIVLFIRYKLKNEEKQRKIGIDEVLSIWKEKFKIEGFDEFFPEVLKPYDLTKGHLGNNSVRQSTRKSLANFSDFVLFFDKHFNLLLLRKKYIEYFGEKNGIKYFENGFELGLNKQDILYVLGQPKDYKKETLKTKVKETLYYSYTKSDNFYVFDDEVLVKIVK